MKNVLIQSSKQKRSLLFGEMDECQYMYIVHDILSKS